ncbi:hypothetical protein MAJ_10799, partial [Metarhizium majus ARSEF 297]
MSLTTSSEARGKKAERSGNSGSDQQRSTFTRTSTRKYQSIYAPPPEQLLLKPPAEPIASLMPRTLALSQTSAKVGRPFSPVAVFVVIVKVLLILELEARRREEGAASELVLESLMLAVISLGPACAPKLRARAFLPLHWAETTVQRMALFSSFARLPIELRQTIWEAAIPAPRATVYLANLTIQARHRNGDGSIGTNTKCRAHLDSAAKNGPSKSEFISTLSSLLLCCKAASDVATAAYQSRHEPRVFYDGD